jgi:hypothetical protein
MSERPPPDASGREALRRALRPLLIAVLLVVGVVLVAGIILASLRLMRPPPPAEPSAAPPARVP